MQCVSKEPFYLLLFVLLLPLNMQISDVIVAIAVIIRELKQPRGQRLKFA